MNITILSGKGGTGKTLISTNLAMYMNANYIDADVEEPNGFIFLKPKVLHVKKVKVDIPYIQQEKCKKCYKCIDFCKFNALAKTQDKILVFDKLCHSCGGCKIVCPYQAIIYKKRTIGKIEEGKNSNITCIQGVLNVGEPMATKILDKLVKEDTSNNINIIDSPPGTSCNVVNILQKTNVAVLVTEATHFGLHDLKRAINLIEQFNIPYGVVINRVKNNDNLIEKYCKEKNIDIITRINYDKNIAETYSKGELLIKNKKYHNIFQEIKEKLLCKYRYLAAKAELEKPQLQ